MQLKPIERKLLAYLRKKHKGFAPTERVEMHELENDIKMVIGGIL